MEARDVEWLHWCIGRIDGALGSIDQSPEHKDEALQAVKEKLETLVKS